MLAMLNGWEIVLILAVVLVLFGAKKLPELAKGLGSGIKEFKKATRDVTDELNSAVNEEPPPPPRKLPPVANEKDVTQTAETVPHSSEPKV
ncbi:MAG TPA: twin-arginine translocase TatA/TatE family subunit [Verrucomicrobiae bacterium]|nr:twin-arginine translocase TatA/TatE family subunit [Verrucomicrobiae bacterium]